MERAALAFCRAAGREVPAQPRAFSRDEAAHLAKMVLSEVLEFLAPTHAPEEARAVLQEEMDRLPRLVFRVPSPSAEAVVDLARQAEQFDALVDAIYYMLDGGAKHGVNLGMDGVFGVVHAANMAKVDPSTGKCRFSDDGKKVLKPDGWQSPDIEAEVQRQAEEGAFPGLL